MYKGCIDCTVVFVSIYPGARVRVSMYDSENEVARANQCYVCIT